MSRTGALRDESALSSPAVRRTLHRGTLMRRRWVRALAGDVVAY
ncbi:hypothetical protein [Mycobacterium spongiae]|nr:hypothetical protein [Mycobacterium spongiae]